MRTRRGIAAGLLVAIVLCLIPVIAFAGNMVSYSAIDAQTGDTISKDNFAEVVEDVSENSVITLLKDVSENITVSKNIQLELNGKTITGTVTVEKDVQLAVSDSSTADYDISDGKYGKIKVDGEGTVVGAPATATSDAYLKIEEDDGYVSFHAVDLNIDQMMLRPEEQGLYFNHQFKGDAKVKAQVESYGIAFSLVDAPEAADLEAEAAEVKEYVYKSGDVVYTQYPTGKVPFGTAATSTSTLITGIMKEDNGYLTNKRNAERPIYGNAFVKLTTGEYVLGVNRQRSMKEQVEGIDTQWEEFNQTQRNGMLKMYKTSAYNSVMKNWDIHNLTDPEKAQTPDEQKILRVLSIGNSHTDNATEYLYNVFKAENPDQEVQIAQLYYSGCSVAQHVNFAATDAAVYRYRTQDNRYPSGYSTMKQALQAQVWDVIILHEMNNSAGSEKTYTGSNKMNLQKHINYVKNNSLNGDPTLIWNFSWANPTSDYLWGLGYPAGDNYDWVDSYQTTYGNDYNYMLDQMIAMTKQYVMTNEAFSDVAPTGLAFKYARDNNPNRDDPDLLLYGDYTHAGPGFGRLLVSYVWYATLTGKTELTELKYTRDLTPEQQTLLIEAVNHALANKADLLPEK